MAALDILPNLIVTGQSLIPIRRAQVNRTRGRAVDAQEDAFVYWRCDFTLDVMERADDAYFQSVMAKIGPSSDGFLCYDILRPRPLSQTVPMTAATGTIGSFPSALSVAVTGAKANLALVAGDYIELRETGGRKHLNIVAANVTLSGAGAGTISLAYPADTANLAGGTVNFEKPSCVMKRIDTQSRSAQRVMTSGGFSAEEIG